MRPMRGDGGLRGGGEDGLLRSVLAVDQGEAAQVLLGQPTG